MAEKPKRFRRVLIWIVLGLLTVFTVLFVIFIIPKPATGIESLFPNATLVATSGEPIDGMNQAVQIYKVSGSNREIIMKVRDEGPSKGWRVNHRSATVLASQENDYYPGGVILTIDPAKEGTITVIEYVPASPLGRVTKRWETFFRKDWPRLRGLR